MTANIVLDSLGYQDVVLAHTVDVRQYADHGVTQALVEGDGMPRHRRQRLQAAEHVRVKIDAEQIGAAEIIVAAEPDGAGSGAARFILERPDEKRSNAASLAWRVDDQRVQFPPEFGMPDAADPADQ